MSASKVEISEDQLNSFCAVTGADPERAKFFLEAANGDIDAAVSSFFEGGASNDTEMPASRSAATSGSAAKRNFLANENLDEHDDDDDDDDDEDYEEEQDNSARRRQEEAAKRAKEKKAAADNKAKATASGNKIFTLSSLNDGGDDDDDEEKGQAFYAGGSETSGQQILGPSLRKNSEKIIKDLFQKAKDNGAQQVESEPIAGTSKKTPVVYGTGYRLGTGDEPTEVIKGPERPKPPKVNVLKLWKNGFNVDDGQLRSYADPQNKEFLEAIEKGQPPRELIKQANGGEVHLDMQDHRDEEFVPPKDKYVLFNDGYKLGSPTPQVVSNTSPNDQESNERAAIEELSVDESKPITQIQIRLSNGSRLIIKANHTHRVAEIRKYIIRARPEYKQVTFSLLTSFPNKVLSNDQETLKEGNLLNAVIIQKL